MSSSVRAALADLLDDAAVRRRTAGLPAWLDPAAVVMPESPEQAAATLAWCSGEGVPVLAAGAGGWLHGGRFNEVRQAGEREATTGGNDAVRTDPALYPPSRRAGMVVLSSVRMGKAGPYDPADLVTGVQAGARLSEVQAMLGQNGQALALDPPAAPDATIGAAVALNAAGPLRAAHGTPRDHVLGVELVTGDGRVLRFGGQVVKNVAGYDVVRLVTGSAGVLGFITSVHLRVAARPEVDRTLVFAVDDAAAAAGLALNCRDAVAPAALEVLGPDGERGEWRVVVRLQGSGDGVADAVHRLQRLGRLADADNSFWPRLARSEAAAALALRLTGRPGELASLLAASSRFAGRILQSESKLGRSPAARLSGVGLAAHAADGVVRVRVSAQDHAVPIIDANTWRQAGAELADEAVTRGWTWRYDVVPGTVRRGDDIDGGAVPADSAPDPRAASLMTQIRHAFDPAGILT